MGALTVAVVGGGLAGLTAATELATRGYTVTVFDKGRGPGGRMARRRANTYHFDHGAQYFTVRDPRFRARVAAWEAEGIVAPWPLRLGVVENGVVSAKDNSEPRYVGTPGMNALSKHLADALGVRFGVRIETLARHADGWHLTTTTGDALGPYDIAIVNTPPAQAVPLLAVAPILVEQAASVVMDPCWATMLAFETPLPVAYDGLFINGGPLGWAERNSSKPGRPNGETWVLHGSPDWSRTHLEWEQADIAPLLTAAFFEALSMEAVAPIFQQAHRWRFSIAQNPLGVGALWDADRRIGVCGDWCAKSRVEGAFVSGMALANMIG